MYMLNSILSSALLKHYVDDSLNYICGAHTTAFHCDELRKVFMHVISNKLHTICNR